MKDEEMAEEIVNMKVPEYLKKKTSECVVETIEDGDIPIKRMGYITDPITGLTFEVVKYTTNDSKEKE